MNEKGHYGKEVFQSLLSILLVHLKVAFCMIWYSAFMLCGNSLDLGYKKQTGLRPPSIG